eukprot:scaffold2589_cov197-Skeletonema_dohrnii-CCMP3373.AAC.2
MVSQDSPARHQRGKILLAPPNNSQRNDFALTLLIPKASHFFHLLSEYNATALTHQTSTMAINSSMKEVSNGESDEDKSKKMNPSVGVCSICNTSKKKDDYTTIQWKRFSSSDKPLPKCRDCQQKRDEKAGFLSSTANAAKKKQHGRMARGGSDNVPITRACSKCMIRKRREHFSKKKWVAAGRGLAEGKCKDCEQKPLDELRVCSSCEKPKEEYCFSFPDNDKEWKKQADKSKCTACIADEAGGKVCCICKEQRKRSEFSKKQRKRDIAFCKACGLRSNSNLADLHQKQAEAEAAPSGRQRSHVADLAVPAKKKPRLHTSEDEMAATESNGVGALQKVAILPDVVSSGAAIMPDSVHSGAAAAPVARVSTIAVARGRGMDNRPARMTRGPHSLASSAAASAFSAPVAERGRGRGVDNRPAWMTRGLGGSDRLSGLAEAPQTAGEHRPSVSATLSMPISHATNGTQVFAPINIPIGIPQQIGAALTAAVSSGSVALDNRTRRQPPVELRVKHEVHITHKVDIHVHHVRDAVNQEVPNLPRVNEEY